MIGVGDVVSIVDLKSCHIDDIISLSKYTKYMLVINMYKVSMIYNKESTACKVMLANGNIEWISLKRIILVSKA